MSMDSVMELLRWVVVVCCFVAGGAFVLTGDLGLGCLWIIVGGIYGESRIPR